WRNELLRLPLHDALPIWTTTTSARRWIGRSGPRRPTWPGGCLSPPGDSGRPEATSTRVAGERRPCCRCPTASPTGGRKLSKRWRSEEHTSELQSRENLVC